MINILCHLLLIRMVFKMDFFDRLIMFLMALFNLYLLWRIDKLDKEKTDVQDIKYIFELLLEKLGIYDEEED